MLNERILNSVGRQNYEIYMVITNGKEIDEILDSCSSVFELYKYRDKLLDEEVGQDITSDELEEFLQDDNDIGLKQKLENLFLESLSKSTFKIVKNMLVNHTFGWNIERLIEIHKRHKYYRIFRLLSIEYNDWISHQSVKFDKKIINKNQLDKKIGYIIKSKKDLDNKNFKYLVLANIGQDPILIKSKLPQKIFDKFCNGKLADKELEQYL
jgi:hypothetical protein